jgi:hypothetical protein
MRCEPAPLAALVAALAVALGGCAISLDDVGPAPTPDGGPPALPACRIFRDEARGVAATGRVRSFTRAAQTVFAVDGLVPAAGGAVIAPAVFAVDAPDAATCLSGAPAALPASAALDVTALGAGLGGTLLATFAVGDRAFAYVRAAQGWTDVGVALAEWDDGAAAFVARGAYLFTADRPAYGDAVLVDGDVVYAYGCQESGFLRQSCYVARAPGDRLDDPTAYEFYRSGGDFGPDPDSAWPIFDGGGGLAVVARGARVYAVYATPLGVTLHARSALGPTGPWSADYELAACDLPAGAFCGGVGAHEALGAGADALAVTYAVGSFDPLPAGADQARLVLLPLTGLP